MDSLSDWRSLRTSSFILFPKPFSSAPRSTLKQLSSRSWKREVDADMRDQAAGVEELHMQTLAAQCESSEYGAGDLRRLLTPHSLFPARFDSTNIRHPPRSGSRRWKGIGMPVEKD